MSTEQRGIRAAKGSRSWRSLARPGLSKGPENERCDGCLLGVAIYEMLGHGGWGVWTTVDDRIPCMTQHIDQLVHEFIQDFYHQQWYRDIFKDQSGGLNVGGSGAALRLSIRRDSSSMPESVISDTLPWIAVFQGRTTSCHREGDVAGAEVPTPVLQGIATPTATHAGRDPFFLFLL